METLRRDSLIKIFEALAPIMPTGKHYIEHLRAVSGDDLKLAEFVYTTFIQSNDFTKEVHW